MAMACFCGFPAAISVRMFWLTACFDFDFLSGILGVFLLSFLSSLSGVRLLGRLT